MTHDTQGAAAPAPIPPRAPPISPLAVASLVCGVLGVITCGLSAIAGLVLGIVSLVRIRRSRGTLGGLGLGVAGTIVSAVVALLFLSLLGLVAARLTHRARRPYALPPTRVYLSDWDISECMREVSSLCMAAEMYAAEHDGRLPPADRWAQALEPYLRNWPRLEHGPYAMNRALSEAPLGSIREPWRTVLFFRAAPGSPAAGGPEHLPPASGPRGRVLVIGFADGHVVAGPDLSDAIWTPEVRRPPTLREVAI